MVIDMLHATILCKMQEMKMTTMRATSSLLKEHWRCRSAKTFVFIHMVTMTSSAIILYGHCCRRRVVGQEIASNISIVCSF